MAILVNCRRCILEHTYLLTYGYTNDEGVSSDNYMWFKSRKEMKDKIQFLEEHYEGFYIDEVLWVTDMQIYKNYRKHNEKELTLKLVKIEI